MKKLKSNFAETSASYTLKSKFVNSSFIRFFTKFPKLFLAELLFAVPLSISVGLFALLGISLGFNNILIWGLGIIPVFPLYAGLTMVIRKISVEKVDIKVFQTFFASVKDNFKRFLIHGTATYIIISCSFFTIIYYYTLAKNDITFGYVLTLYCIFIFILLTALFYIPLMTITYDLSLKDIYKNSFLLVFGKILKNVITFLLLLIVSAITLLALIYSQGILLIIVAVLSVLLYPLIASYLIVSLISKPLQDTVGAFVGVSVEKSSKEEEEFLMQTISENTTDDYVFVNGRMVKNPNKVSKNGEE